MLSVVIPVRNNWWLTRRCLDALAALRTEGATAFDVIVVDNASTDETPAAMQRDFSWVCTLRQETNLNFAGACNVGAKAAQAPVVLFLNNDAVPLGDALTPIRAAFSDDRVAIAAGRLVFEDGVLQANGMVLLPNAQWWHSHRHLPDSPAHDGATYEAAAVPGAAMAVRRDWFLAAGGFDQAYRNGYEDVDLCMRAGEDGRNVRFVADAAFAHYEGATDGRFDHEQHNEMRFFRRWHRRLHDVARVERGEVGAVVVRRDTHGDLLLDRALDDLLGGMRSFGHPMVADRIAPWSLVNRRFRIAASLDWFAPEPSPRAGVTVAAGDDGFAALTAHGAYAGSIPWLPGVDAERAAHCGVRHADDVAARRVGVFVAAGDTPEKQHAVAAAVAAVRASDPQLEIVALDGQMLFAHGEPTYLDVAIFAGLTDTCAYGNVLLARAGIPTVVLEHAATRRIYADDVAFIGSTSALPSLAERALRDVASRRAKATCAVADFSRRFSPRRSAMRVLDLARVARSGLERPARARADSPIPLG